MQAMGYTRVSTSEQAADGVSLRVQATSVDEVRDYQRGIARHYRRLRTIWLA